MEKNLGHATAYGYAKSKGYSGTEEEFAQLMADYASVGQSAAQSAEQAAASATSASGSAATASQAAQTATIKASEAVTAADTATTKASEASQSARTASSAATSASTSAQTATTAASTATTKASEAAASANTATTAKTDAESARDSAAQSASEAAESARTLTIDPTLTQSGQAADAKETGDRIDDLRDTIATSGNDINKSDLQTGYYYKIISGYVVELASNENSVYIPLVDVSEYVGGKLKIKVSSINTGSGRFFGFCNEEYKSSVNSAYMEPTAGFIEVDDGYEVEIPITDDYFFFSFSSSAEKIHISYYKLKIYDKNEVDTLFRADAKEIGKIKSDLNQIYLNSILTKEAVTAEIYPFTITAGKTYIVTNLTDNNTVGVRTCDSSGTAIEVIKNGMAHNEVVEFTATIDASYVRVYSTAPHTEVSISTTGAVLDNVVSEFSSEINDLENKVIDAGSDINKSDLQTGYYYKRVASTTSVELVENASSVYLPLLDVSNYIGGKLKIQVSSINTGSTRMFGFCDGEYIASSLYAEMTADFIEVDGGYEIEIPITDNYFFFSFSSSAEKIHISYYIQFTYNKGYIDELLSEEDAKITTLNKVTGIDSDNEDPLSVTRIDVSANNRARTPIFDRKKYWKRITVSTMVSDFQCTIFVNGSTSVMGWVNEIDRYKFADNVETFYVAFRHSDNTAISVTDLDTILQNLAVTIEYDVLSSGSDNNKKVAYVSVNGSDDNLGTATSPYATVNKALQAGANVILLTAGEYIQTIDLANTTESTIELRNITFHGKVIFKPSLSILATTETLVSGYTRVYSSQTANFVSDNIKWLWQHGVADISTEISDSERHPAQRGQVYRLDDTKIVKCSSTTLSEALSEIEDATDTYKWFFDSTNLVLYFSRPELVTSEHSICGDVGHTLLFSNPNRSKSIKAYGIETKYMAFNVIELTNPELYDCKASNVCNAGGFRYDRSIGAKFTRCEACSVESGLNGDGFNAHSIKSGDPFAKQTTVSLIDCWSHDNQDDGYSDHERSETVIRGGLYEYNGKAGVTPSYGSHCSVHDVMSRKNYNGFYLTGDAAADEGGKYSQVVCYNCVSIENTIKSDYGGSGRGFAVSGVGNKMILVNCKSIDDTIGYQAATGTSIELIDCGASGNTTVKSGNITVKNTTVVS